MSTAVRPEPDAGAPAIEWRFNPWRERPRQAGMAVAASLLMAALVVSLREHPIVTLGLALVAAAALSPVFLPARCRLDDRGAARRGPWGWERRAWEDVRRSVLHPGGLLVSPFEHPSWLEPYRALVLPLPRTDTGLRAAISDRLAAHGF